jgi:RNA polymerase sigma-70 factor (sigma-E family)
MRKRLASETQPNHKAMRAAFEQHYVTLFKLSVALSGRREIAEDIVQDAFVAAAPRIGQLGSEEVGPYMRRVVVNLWKNRLRRLAVEIRHRRGIGAVGRSEPTQSFEDRDEVWRALSRLPDRQRACVVLRHYMDLSEREVAEVLGCSLGTVKSQTARALTKLRREIGYGD